MDIWESVWPGMAVLLLLIPLFFLPIFAVARENSDIRLDRPAFGIWILGVVAVHALIWLAGAAFDQPAIALLAGLMFWIAIAFPLYTRFVRRARDAGFGKTIAFLSIVPLVNIVTTAILLLRPGTRRPDVSRLFD